MKRPLRILLVGMLVATGGQCLSATASLAEEGFYVEVGGDTTAEEASKQWEALVEKHKTLLGKLKFFPKSIVQGGDSVGTRIQAGPIASKEKAQKICSKLFKQNVPCFVIEGLSEAPKSVMNLSEQSERAVKVVQLPWLASSDAPPAPIQELPVASDDAPVVFVPENESNKDVGGKQADVKVAEAIRVPLTEGEDQQRSARVTVKALPNIKPVSAPGGLDSYPDERDDSGKGWLTVGDFLNEEIATSFWGEVRISASKQAKKLRVRVLRPLLASSDAKTSLNLGPFTSSSEAYNFCREGIQARDRGLNCTFSNNEPGADEFKKAAASPNSESYAAARQASRIRPVENPATVAGTLSKQYWVQVLSASSQIEALHQWEELKAKNDDLISGMRNSITPSIKDKDTYVVRVGPIKDNSEAIKLCSKMQERSINCRVILYSTVGH